MNTASQQNDVWTKIEKEKSVDRLIRRVSKVAWTATGAALLIYSGMVVAEVVRAVEHVAAGTVSASVIGNLLLPLIMVVGSISLLIAILATVGVFFRLRTASLSEIQLRLAALEEMFVAQSDSA